MSLHALIAEMRERAALQPYNDMALLAIRWADKLEAALAGGGEAVAWRVHCPSEPELGTWIDEEKPRDNCGLAVEPLFTHPAGAVQVDEAMVERACDAFTSHDAGDWLRNAMRVALFAALNPGGSRDHD